LFTRKVVGWRCATHARELTIARSHGDPRAAGGGSHPSFDRGSQYAARDYRDILETPHHPNR